MVVRAKIILAPMIAYVLLVGLANIARIASTVNQIHARTVVLASLLLVDTNVSVTVSREKTATNRILANRILVNTVVGAQISTVNQHVNVIQGTLVKSAKWTIARNVT